MKLVSQPETGDTAASPRRELSRERIVATALGLLDQEGRSALSMRRLADSLGVGTMTVYHYVSDKADLTTGVLELVLSDLHRPSPDETWVELARALSHSFRRIALEHPAAYMLLVTRPPPPTALALAADMAAAGRRAGLSDDQARALYRTVSRFVLGWCLTEVAELPERTATRVRVGGDEDFAFGLDAVLDGLASALDRGPGPR